AKGFPFAKAARKDSAVHVSLSSDSLFKQPGILRSRAGRAGQAKTRSTVAATRTWPRLHGRMLGHRVNSEGLRRRAIAPGGGASKRVVYSLEGLSLSTFQVAKTPCELPKIGQIPPACASARRTRGIRLLDRPSGPCRAALRPHSSVDLHIIIRGVATGERDSTIPLLASVNRPFLRVGSTGRLDAGEAFVTYRRVDSLRWVTRSGT